MSKTNIKERFASLAKQSMAEIAKNIIVKRKNDYVVFDRFRIVKDEDRFKVLEYGHELNTFLSSRNALSFCIFRKRGDIDKADFLARLDSKLQQKLFNIEVSRNILINSKDMGKKYTALARVDLDIEESKSAKRQISECVELAKYFQEKGLDNEIN